MIVLVAELYTLFHVHSQKHSSRGDLTYGHPGCHLETEPVGVTGSDGHGREKGKVET